MDEAVAVLQAAVGRGKDGPQTGADVRLALKALRFVGVPGEAVRYFWASCQIKNEIDRTQNMNAALNRIELYRDGTFGSGK